MRKRDKLIRAALIDLLESPFPGDRQGRTGAELLALATFREALSGNVAAAKEITDRVEGKVADQAEPPAKLDSGEVRERIQLLVEKLRGEAPLRLQESGSKPQ
jgi:hypothetical protein